jgi:YD repeat-containing protein
MIEPDIIQVCVHPFTQGSFFSCLVGGSTLANVAYTPDQSAELGPCTQCQAQAGAPINVITGNTWIQQQDYALQGLGGGIELTRTWNSTWSNNRPPKQVSMFGDGWTSTYEENLSQSGSGLKYWLGAGTAWTFSFNSSTGIYTLSTPSDARGTLTFNSTLNQYAVTLKDGTKRIFDSSGRLLKLLDRNANTSNLVYDNSGRLTTVTDTVGRTLNFAYADPSNLNQVTTISDAVGTIASYTYAPNGVLSSVIYTDGSGFNFTSDASNLITNVTDPGGKTIESHSYDSMRRGLSSAEANNVRSVSISYTGSGTSQLTDTFGNVTSVGSQTINRKHYISSSSGPGCSTCGAVPGDSYTYDSQGNRASQPMPWDA